MVNTPKNLESFFLKNILEQLRPLKKWLGGVCISGGEPALDPTLPDILLKLKTEGYELKIDTNGSRPEVLKSLLDQGMLHMISMDVKAPLDQDKYNRVAGINVDLDLIRKSIDLIRRSGIDHEFRMTVVPGLHQEEDVVHWRPQLGDQSPLKIQNYKPDSVLDPLQAGTASFNPYQFRALEKIIE